MFYNLSKVIKSLRTQQDYFVYRFVDDNYLKIVFNFVPTLDIFYNLKKIKEQIGSIKIEKGFMSCFMSDKHIIERNIKLQIKVPKGTHAYITQNEDESEIILNCNTEYRISDAFMNNNIIQINACILVSGASNTSNSSSANLSAHTIAKPFPASGIINPF